jgi:hypothetical protein
MFDGHFHDPDAAPAPDVEYSRARLEWTKVIAVGVYAMRMTVSQ